MAGANKILKPGQMVFKAGDPADGMYIVRRGELVVFLEQNSKEVVLAKVAEGGMVGEMALFDRQPRSASVKAGTKETEITYISLDDFTKLMKQIPKWFVGIMAALSGRLRTTNDRLKQVENALTSQGSGSSEKYLAIVRSMNLLELIWHKDGSKEGKDWVLARKLAETQLMDVLASPQARVAAFIDALIAEQLLTSKLDNYKNAVLVMVHRAALRNLLDFMANLKKVHQDVSSIPEGCIDALRVLEKFAGKSAYEQLTVTFEDLKEEAVAQGLDPSQWKDLLQKINGLSDTYKIVKSSTPSGVGIRIEKNSLVAFTKQIAQFNRFWKRMGS